jgi:antitoxin (DNA-binding transcriptional repressor) of toxin-antitoxin stability system
MVMINKKFLDKLSNSTYIYPMKTMAVGEIKTHFSQILSEVKQGEKIGILFGRAKNPIAMIVPYMEEKKSERKIGILDGKVKIEFMSNFKMTTEELCGLGNEGKE